AYPRSPGWLEEGGGPRRPPVCKAPPIHAERRHLLEDQRELLDRRGDDQRIGVRSLDLGELRAHVLRRLVHGLNEADLDSFRLEHLAEVVGCAAAPIVIDDEEIDFLDPELVNRWRERDRLNG